MPGMLIIGSPSTAAEDGARKKLWWDYDLIARRVIGRQGGPWDDAAWARVTDIALGALATSRHVFLGAHTYDVFSHAYVRAQREHGLVAMLACYGRPRHGLVQQQLLAIQRDLLAAAAHLDIPVLESIADAATWIKTKEKDNDAIRSHGGADGRPGRDDGMRGAQGGTRAL